MKGSNEGKIPCLRTQVPYRESNPFIFGCPINKVSEPHDTTTFIFHPLAIHLHLKQISFWCGVSFRLHIYSNMSDGFMKIGTNLVIKSWEESFMSLTLKAELDRPRISVIHVFH